MLYPKGMPTEIAAKIGSSYKNGKTKTSKWLKPHDRIKIISAKVQKTSVDSKML